MTDERYADQPEEDEEPTIVIFRKWRTKDAEVIAVFPEIPHSDDGPGDCTAYAHIGGHCGSYFGRLIDSTRPAKPEEYADLKRELESAPYHYQLVVRQRYSRRRSTR